ncbi:aldehyde ferredoxin oxidoreductase C-terminal domain-containing protein [Isoptericola hypogeus]|uniref:aldehyde ferredoxin oxidoreductase C-terminal domain-containing protein n=1 Tax=Isoptericola hypogeus TaxID=300179 RepID=UPI003CD076EC
MHVADGRRGAEKARATARLWQFGSGCEALGVCVRDSPPTGTLTEGDTCALVGAMTSWSITPDEVLAIGRRRRAVQWRYNLREGISPGGTCWAGPVLRPVTRRRRPRSRSVPVRPRHPAIRARIDRAVSSPGRFRAEISSRPCGGNQISDRKDPTGHCRPAV